MEVTVLGASAACPNPGGACSGYLIRAANDILLLDCGSGVVSNLQKHIPCHALTAVLISHLHPDHVLDLIPLCYGLRYSPGRNANVRLLLCLPPQGAARLKQVVEPLDGTPTFFDDVFVLNEYDPTRQLVLGSMAIDFVEVKHYVQTHAVRISAGGKAMVYSADTGPCEDLASFARGADLFICEATLQSRAEAAEGEWGHLAGREAGRIARQAGVKRLLLTHIWHQNDAGRLLQEAGAVYRGPIDLATEGMVIRV